MRIFTKWRLNVPGDMRSVGAVFVVYWCDQIFSVSILVEGKGFLLLMEFTSNQRSSRVATLLGFIAMVLIWGSFPVVVKIGIANVPPLLFSAIRFCIAFCVMAVIAVGQRKNLRIRFKEHLQISLVSLFMVGIPSCIFFVSALYAPVSVLTLMWATAPIFTALFNMRGKGEIDSYRTIGS